MDVQNQGRSPEHLTGIPQNLAQPGFHTVKPGKRFRGGIKQAGHRGIVNGNGGVEGQLQKGAQIVPGVGVAHGAVIIPAEGIPGRILGKGIVGIQALHFQSQPRKSSLELPDGFLLIQGDPVQEGKFLPGKVVGRRAVVQQQRGIHRNHIPEHLGHGQASSGIHREAAAVGDKIGNGLHIPLRDCGVRGGEGAVKVHRQQNIRKRSHIIFLSGLSSFPACPEPPGNTGAAGQTPSPACLSGGG